MRIAALACLVAFAPACTERNLGWDVPGEEPTPAPQGKTPVPTPAPRTGPNLPVFDGARLFFSWVGGAAAVGGGVEILADGTARGWGTSSDLTSGPPDFETKLEPASVEDLFQRLSTVSWSSLPHPRSEGNECEGVGRVRLCGTCPESVVVYDAAERLLPELQPSWNWFSDQARGDISISDFTPATYCAF